MEMSQVMLKVRGYLGDTGSMQISDWQITEGIADGLRILADVNKNLFGHTFREFETIDMTGGEGDIPDDFVSVDRVFSPLGNELFRVTQSIPQTSEYAIRGSKIYSGEDSVTISYFSSHPRIDSSTYDIELHDRYLVPLAYIASMVVKGDMNGAVSFASAMESGNYAAPPQAGEKE